MQRRCGGDISFALCSRIHVVISNSHMTFSDLRFRCKLKRSRLTVFCSYMFRVRLLSAVGQERDDASKCRFNFVGTGLGPGWVGWPKQMLLLLLVLQLLCYYY